MRKTKWTLWICLYAFAGFAQTQQTVNLKAKTFEDGTATTIPTRNVEAIENGWTVTYTFDKAMAMKDPLFPGCMTWRMEGFGVCDTEAKGAYLSRIDSYTVPKGCSVRVEVIDSAYTEFSCALSPARAPLPEATSVQRDVSPINPFTGYLPRQIVYVKEEGIYRGTSVAQIAVCPIQYSHEQKKTRVYTSIKYSISFVRDSTTPKAAVISHVDTNDNFLNNTTLNGWTGGSARKAQAETPSATRGYLIISCPKYRDAVKRMEEWKKTLGFQVHTILKDRWTSDTIKATVQKVYDENPSLYYLLIVGAHDDLPGQYRHDKDEKDDEYRYTDLYYTCMDGTTDSVPDLYRGRLSVSNEEEANTVVNKIIQYEKEPTTDPYFYEKGLNCAFFEDEDSCGKEGAGYEDTRFVKTSEEVRDYLSSKHKDISRVYYAHYSVDKKHAKPSFYNDGVYSFGEPLPHDLSDAFSWEGKASDINSLVNSGAFYVLYRGHASEEGWNYPKFHWGDVNLRNYNKYPVIFSLTCLTGRLDHGCFAEKMLRMEQSGCVAIYAASDYSFSGYNDALCAGMFDAIWPDPGLRIRFKSTTTTGGITPIPTYELGQILDQGMVRMKETYGAMYKKLTKRTEEIFYCYGDPSMMIYTETPTAFDNVRVDRGTNAIYVSVDEPAKISFYDKKTGEVYSIQGTSATLPTRHSSLVSVSVSGHNKIPTIDEGRYPECKYIQNQTLTGTNTYKADIIKVGAKVTTEETEGKVVFGGGKTTLSAKEVILAPGTTVKKGAELKILTQ